MSSSESSDTSRSQSPTESDTTPHPLPNLERLVGHFVSAKRALGATQHVQHATELVSSSRLTIEDIAIVGARNNYIRSRASRQVEILHVISDKIATNAAEIDQEFQSVITRLDETNDRLQATIESLKEVVVAKALDKNIVQPVSEEGDNGDSGGNGQPTETQQKTLFDYVDEAQYNELSEILKTLIDSFHDSRAHLDQQLDGLNTAAAQVSALASNSQRPESPTIKTTLYDEPLLPPAEAFSQMEEHAGEMAGLLQSLISHYDLCVSALKHTEGGREAARQAVLDADEDEHLAKETMDESLYEHKVADSITKDERSEMLRVIEGDAVELDDVVEDLRAREAEIERFHQQMNSHSEVSRSLGRQLVRAVKLVRRTRDTLPTYIDAIDRLKASWIDIHDAIAVKTQDIANLTAFYEEFINGYNRLLKEVDRRANAESQMRKVAEKAQKELDRLYDIDRAQREEFVEDVGSFLPSDLWPGGVESGVRWHIHARVPSGSAGEQGISRTHGIEVP